MHKLPSSSAVRRLRLASLLLCAKCMLTPAAILFMIYALLINDTKMILAGLASVLFVTGIVIIQWITSARTHCPLCLTPVLAKKNCAKHRDARRFLGSHRLRVALGVIFTGSFRCPYCNEPSKVEVRYRDRVPYRDPGNSRPR